MAAQPQVNERLAAVLMGLPPHELRILARQAALGQPGSAAGEMVFTYEELRRLCLLAAASTE